MIFWLLSFMGYGWFRFISPYFFLHEKIICGIEKKSGLVGLAHCFGKLFRNGLLVRSIL